MVPSDEILPQLPKIVDLAVKNDSDGLSGIEHWLIAGHEIDDRKPAMAEPDSRAKIKTFTIGAAVADGIRHCLHEGGRRRTLARCVEPAAYATHERMSGRVNLRARDR